ncbi:MAG TPA: hypothetical protein VGU43_01575 [Thermoplasmata archaeon]|nr:hypothetical protein [Thermoplasmata archaeon]
MKLTGSYLDLYVYTGGLGGTLVWSNTNSLSDTAANFNVDASYDCNGVNEVGYTGYEEVYNIATSQSFPQWDFQFANAFGGGSRIQSWGTLAQAVSPYTLPTSPHGYYMDYTAGNYFIRIANEAVWIAFPWDAPVIAQGGGFTDNGYLIAIGSASPTQACTGNPTCKYTLAWTIPNNPTTWNANAIQSSIYVPATLSFSATSYSTTTPGLYYAVCVLTITSFSVNEVTSYIWYIYVT